jgi:outer membrane lipoprotein SlyB
LRRFITCLGGLAILVSAGCANPSLSGDVYSRSDAGRAMQAHDGTVRALRRVTIEGEPTALGTSGGGLVGYSLGRVIGSGSGSRVAGAVGGVAGAVAGQQVEKSVTTENGLEITVDMDRGDVLVIVQSDDVLFSAGEPVRVLLGRDGAARVLKAPSP